MYKGQHRQTDSYTNEGFDETWNAAISETTSSSNNNAISAIKIPRNSSPESQRIPLTPKAVVVTAAPQESADAEKRTGINHDPQNGVDKLAPKKKPMYTTTIAADTTQQIWLILSNEIENIL
jgi:hypothetical protein